MAIVTLIFSPVSKFVHGIKLLDNDNNLLRCQPGLKKANFRKKYTRCFHLIPHWISRFTHQNKRKIRTEFKKLASLGTCIFNKMILTIKLLKLEIKTVLNTDSVPH